jgi:hypothetical protein
MEAGLFFLHTRELPRATVSGEEMCAKLQAINPSDERNYDNYKGKRK